MKRTLIFQFCCAGLVLTLAGAMLAACKPAQPTPSAASRTVADTFTSEALATSYPRALSASNQLMLGILRLEGTTQAITPEQAATLLPVAQSLQGSVLKSDAERNAVLAFIEAQLAPAQSSAIAGMRLTQDDLLAWTQSNSQSRGGFPGQAGGGMRGTPDPASGGRPEVPVGGPGGGTALPDMATRRAQFGSMTEEQRATAMAGIAPRGTGTSNGQPGAFPRATGTGQGNVLLVSLIRLLAQKAEGAASPSPAGRLGTPGPGRQAQPVSTPRP